MAPNEPQAPSIEHRCTASLGATLFKGQALGLQELMKKTDAAMYQAKAAGRNRVQFDAALGGHNLDPSSAHLLLN